MRIYSFFVTESFSWFQTGPPVIVIAPKDTTMNMSQDALLQCHADAYPSNLTYEWLKKGQNVYNLEWVLISFVSLWIEGNVPLFNLRVLG